MYILYNTQKLLCIFIIEYQIAKIKIAYGIKLKFNTKAH